MADLTWTTRNTRLVGLRMTLEGIDPARPQSVLRDLAREADWQANRQVRKGKIGRVLPTGQIAQAGLAISAGSMGNRFRMPPGTGMA